MATSLQGLTALQIGRQIREALRCSTCGKSIVVVNTAGYRREFVSETVTVETHCTCVGGPAHGLVAPLCPTCNGYGEIDDHHRPPNDLTPPTIPCPDPRCPGAVR